MVRVPARIYHYGYVRDPALMATKKRVQDAIHGGREVAPADAAAAALPAWDYGPLGELPRFTGTHPQVMQGFLAHPDWRSWLDQGRRRRGDPVRHKHERLKYRLLSWLERRFTDNRELFGWKNYVLARPSRRPARASLSLAGQATVRTRTAAGGSARSP